MIPNQLLFGEHQSNNPVVAFYSYFHNLRSGVSVCIHLLLVFNSCISVSIWVQVFQNVSGQSRFELAVTMSRRKEAIEELRRSMPGPSCKPVRTVLDPKGNAMSITDRRARDLRGNTMGITVNRPQY